MKYAWELINWIGLIHMHIHTGQAPGYFAVSLGLAKSAIMHVDRMWMVDSQTKIAVNN